MTLSLSLRQGGEWARHPEAVIEASGSLFGELGRQAHRFQRWGSTCPFAESSSPSSLREGRLDVVEAKAVAALWAADHHHVSFVIEPVGSEMARALLATNGLP
jgi:hypothetical protein